MICNDEELAVVRKQLALAEHALDALRHDILNPRTFAVLSEGYVDQIADLKAEIDSYRPAKVAAKRKPRPTRKPQKT